MHLYVEAVVGSDHMEPLTSPAVAICLEAKVTARLAVIVESPGKDHARCRE
jgi:hypothetical protein